LLSHFKRWDIHATPRGLEGLGLTFDVEEQRDAPEEGDG
jgi:hypothetical protein